MGSFLLLFLVFFPILTAFALLLFWRHDSKYRDLFIRIVHGIELACSLLLLFTPSSAVSLPGVCGLGLYFTAGSLRSLLVVLTAFLWMMTILFSKEYFAQAKKCNRFYLFCQVTLGAVMGVFLAADLYTLFIFFEVMSFTSYVWVVHNETPEAIQAGTTYLAVAVAGGMAMLVGLFLLYRLLGTLQIDLLFQLVSQLSPDHRPALAVAGVLCLIGFGAKAGVFPLHIWLPKAYPAAPAPGSALLSSILSKTGIFGILVISVNLFVRNTNWNMLLLILAFITMVLGALLALFSTNLKRTLACSSMSQIGFILLGVAMQGFLTGENALATWGTILHMTNHSLIKMVLFVGAGIVFVRARSLDLNEIRGWGRNKPWLKATFLIAITSICGVPLSSGYISKTLLHESIVEYIHFLAEEGAPTGLFHAAEWLFLISGGLTVAYMTKIFVAVFVEKGANSKQSSSKNYMSNGTRIALGCGCAVMVILGLTPSITMEKIGIWSGAFLRGDLLEEQFHYFSLSNLKGAGISIAIGFAVYFLLVRTLLRKEQQEKIIYLNRWPSKLDLEDLFYRPVIQGLCFVGALCARSVASVGDLIIFIAEKILFLRAPRYITPKRNENFGVYGKSPLSLLVPETFSFGLMLSGLGLSVMLLYILLK